MLDKLRKLVRPDRQSGNAVVSIAQRALRRPLSLSPEEIKSLAASVLSQARVR